MPTVVLNTEDSTGKLTRFENDTAALLTTVDCSASPCSSMAKGKKPKQPKTKTISLKMAQSCIELSLDGIRRLDLSFKEITTVPKCIQKLCAMDELDLSRNLIRKIPDFIDQFTSITVLDLHSNYLEELPVVIGRLQTLLVLNLCNNRLTSLPDELGLLKKLHTLNLGINQLETLPRSIAALKELRNLGLSDNRFTQVPFCLSRLNKLERVNLDRNPIIIEQMPSHESFPGTERLYLVKESFLCKDCLHTVKIERRKMEEAVKSKTPKLLSQTNLPLHENREI
ncbi:Leucine-rich repeat-containing protein 18 Testis-specific LRR protein [Channa argus]|uniref:Leucine-rich repeat-containing protein 18 Testis-specific LRR protein n=2 Tax=Channa argus TaxID=215402 RepID=A0A6G1QRI4_CHAAH|nr:Leucine-rich repeat-containing protein 18 Testis-specific LRR protein [Channa argus]